MRKSLIRHAEYNNEYYGGALLLIIGLYVVFVGRAYDVGTLREMGPGFFPVALGLIMSVIGVAVALGAKRGEEAPPNDAHSHGGPRTAEWRGWLCIILSIVAFVVLGQHFGFVPASFAVVFISAMGDRENSWRTAFLLSIAGTIFGVVVFWWALKIQLPLFAFGG